MIGSIIEAVQGLISPEMKAYNKALKDHQSGGRMGGRGTGWEAKYGLPSLDELTATEERDNRNWLIKLAIVGALTFTPFLPQSFPGSLKTLSLLSAAVLSTVFYAQEQSQGLRERRRSLFNLSELRKDRRQNAARHQQVFDQQVGDIRSYNRLIALGNTLPMGQRMSLFQELGLEGWVPEGWIPTQKQATNPQFLGELPNQTLELPGSNLDPLRSAVGIYQKALGKHGKRVNFFFLGGMGDAKTVSAHFMLWCFLNDSMLEAQISEGEIKPPIVMVFDPHYGKNDDPKYLSTWCGLPYLGRNVPKKLENCAIKGSSESLFAFLDLAVQEFKYRRDNDLSLNDRPPLLFIIDEYSNLVGGLEADEQKAISGMLKTFGTESRKFGISFWLIGHSCTKTDINLERIVIRACTVAVGYKIMTDSVQMTNLPCEVSPIGITEVKTRKMNGADVAGLATNSFAAPYLPPSPLNSIEMQFQWSKAGVAVVETPVVAVEDDRLEAVEAVEAVESAKETARRMREGLVALRQWWAVQPGNPTNEQIILLWSRYSGDSEASAAESVVQLRGFMGLSQEVFDERIANLKQQEDKLDG